MEGMAQLIAVLEANGQKMDRLIALLEKDKKEWVDPDEACAILGIGTTSSGSNRRRLQYLREKGFLTRFGQRRPYTYCKKQVQDVADKIRREEIYVLGMNVLSK